MTSSPAASAARVVSGPIDTTGKPVPSAARARAAEGEAARRGRAAGNSCGRSSTGAVEGDDVRVERLGKERPRSLAGREQHAAGGARELREQPFLGRDRGDEIGAAERLCRRRPDRGEPGHRAGAPVGGARGRRSRS